MVPTDSSSHYGRYTGGPDPLAAPVDLAGVLDAIAEDVMNGYSPGRALREFLRRGTADNQGLDALAGRVQARRRELLGRHRLDGTLEEVKRLLDTAVLEERKQLARDPLMDETDRAFRETLMQDLPASTAAAVTELAGYDWQSGTARQAYERIKDLLGREVLDQRFAGMKEALENATAQDRAEVAEMLADLNELLENHRRGEDSETDFREFMERHGGFFPENPQSVEELIDILAKRSAAAARLLQSMSAEQREELMRLSAQAFGSSELMAGLDRLDASLRALRPGEDWSGSEEFKGQQGLGLGDGTGVLADLAELDELAEQLAQSHNGAHLDDVDLEALARQLDERAAVSARALVEIERAMHHGGYLRRGADGELRLSPQAVRRLGKSLLQDTHWQRSARQGARDTRSAGSAGEQIGSSRPWRFGDPEPWDVTRTLGNTILRTIAEGGATAHGLRLGVADIEVVETEARTQAAVALLVDVSFSMAAEGRWLPMKRMALALHQLVSTRFRGDRLDVITFGRMAQSTGIDSLTALAPLREQGTNLHHGLLLAGRFFRRYPAMAHVVLIVTDGEPTAHLDAAGQSLFAWPPEPETIALTVAELERLGRAGAHVTFFRLGEDPGLARFVQGMARRIGGRVIAPDEADLGGAVVDEYLRTRRRD